MIRTLYQWCWMLLTLLFANANQCFSQLRPDQFKPLSDSVYQTVPEYQTGNKYQKDAILFMDMVADTHPYYFKEERRAEWFSKRTYLGLRQPYRHHHRHNLHFLALPLWRSTPLPSPQYWCLGKHLLQVLCPSRCCNGG